MFVESDVVDLISQMCDGDARCALNSLQNLIDSKSSVDMNDVTIVTVDDAREALQRSHVQYDRLGTMNSLYASLLHVVYIDVHIFALHNGMYIFLKTALALSAGKNFYH